MDELDKLFMIWSSADNAAEYFSYENERLNHLADVAWENYEAEKAAVMAEIKF